jgi:hypothetical protein
VARTQPGGERRFHKSNLLILRGGVKECQTLDGYIFDPARKTQNQRRSDREEIPQSSQKEKSKMETAPNPL